MIGSAYEQNCSGKLYWQYGREAEVPRDQCSSTWGLPVSNPPTEPHTNPLMAPRLIRTHPVRGLAPTRPCWKARTQRLMLLL
jgi:hypothetical protein